MAAISFSMAPRPPNQSQCPPGKLGSSLCPLSSPLVLLMLLGLLLLPLLWEGCLSQELEVPSSVTVQEGLCAQILCTFPYPVYPSYNYSPAYGSWYRVGTNPDTGRPVATNDPRREVESGAKGRFRFLGDPRMHSCSLSITDAQSTDSGQYFFHIEKGDKKYTFYYLKVSVKVTGFSQKPDISVPEVLESGAPVTLNCTFPYSCWDKGVFRFSWSGAALSSPLETSGLSPSSRVSFTPGHQHHGTPLTCQVTLPGTYLRAQRTIFLNVSYAVQNVTITLSQGNRTTVWVPGISPTLVAQEGESLQLLCAAISNP
ncbi:sialic acid-binding Ig-like lectin 13, partial [Gracilinanus agilis]|uniref:sialic acid-binding Ig-like lectin 13 n=1 Tax=Gracilinanus agilis TaxID=191870 RepID=UPI001CFD9CE4